MSVRTLLSALNSRPTAMSVMALLNDIAVGTELASD
jgi:hexokinase